MTIARSVASGLTKGVASAVTRGQASGGGGGGNSIAVDLTSDLRAAWDFAEASGNRVDEVNSLALVPEGTITTVAGINSANAIHFGTDANSMLSIAANSNLALGEQDWTVCGWVRFADATSTQCFFSKGSRNINAEVAVYKGSGGRCTVELYNGITTKILTHAFTTVFNNDTWHFVAFRHINASKEFTAVVDDTAKSVVYSGTLATPVPGPFTIGSFPQGVSPTDTVTNTDFDGWAKWDRALTDAELLQLYNGGTGTFYPFAATSLALTAERVIYSSSIGLELDPAKGTNTSATGQHSKELYTPAVQMRHHFCSSFSNYGATTGENAGLYSNDITIAASAFIDGQAAADALTFDSGANSSKTLALQAMVVSDQSISGFRKQAAKTRTYITVANGTDKWPATHQTEWYDPSANQLAAATDFVGAWSGAYGFGPSVIVGKMPLYKVTGRLRNTVSLRGDSIGAAYLHTIAESEKLLHLPFCRPGEKMTDLLRSGADTCRTVYTRLCDVIVDEYGVNDLSVARTAAQIQADKISMWTAWFATSQATRLVCMSITPCPDYDTTERNALNAWMAGLNSASASALIGKDIDYVYYDINDSVETSAGSNAWKIGHSDDNVHPNGTGYAAIYTDHQTGIADAITDEIVL